MTLAFQRVTPDNLERLRPFFRSCGSRICNHTLAYTMIWRDYLHTEYAIHNDALFLRSRLTDNLPGFSQPIGGSAEENMALLERFCRKEKQPFRFFAVPEPYFRNLQARYLDMRFRAPREYFDYLYRAEDMAFFRGKRYAGQRNHINRFEKLYPAWHHEDLTEQNLPLARELLARWTPRGGLDSVTAKEERDKTNEMLSCFSRYALPGGLLCAHTGQAAAFWIGERIGDTFFVHVEKADTDFHGSYQTVVRECARRAFENGAVYINRGEDDGVEGMRASKLSYHPTDILAKYDFDIPL